MILFLSLPLTGCKKAESISCNGFFFDTIIKVTIYDSNQEELLSSCMKLCEKYEALFSRTIKTSDISRINENGGRPVTVSDDTIDILQKAISYGELSDGLFDVTIAPASSLWDFKSDTPALPDKNELKEAISHIDYRTIQISGNTVTLLDSKAQIDLGGIAKGYIADRMKSHLISKGVEHATINLGGNVLTIGGKPDGTPFHIGIQKPFDERNSILTSVDVTDRSVVSSGSYERFFTLDGQLYHHILNPRTGYPVDSGLSGVTILSDSSVDGDALATICFALGQEKGMALIRSLDGVDALFVDTNGKVSATFPIK